MAMKTNGYTEGHAKQNISPSTQRTDSGLRAVKTYDNDKCHARLKEDSWEVTDGNAEGCSQKATSVHSGQTLV